MTLPERVAVALLWALAAAWPTTALAAPRPEARALRAAAPPRIDGRLDDAAWRAAPWHGRFVERKPRLASEPPVRTRFAVVFDGAALYMGVHCHDDRPDQVRGRSRARDSFSLFRDDAISIKIDAASDGRTTLGFVLGPAGARTRTSAPPSWPGGPTPPSPRPGRSSGTSR